MLKKYLVAALVVCMSAPTATAGDMHDDVLRIKLNQVEKRLGGRVGAAIFDTSSGREWLFRSEERFPLLSTFKVFACGAVLARVDAGQENLERSVPFNESDLMDWSPVTKNYTDVGELTLSQLCEAAMTMSDNTAANLVLDSIGGADGFTAFMRSIGDHTSRLDRSEPALNEGAPGDIRDTTSPLAAATSIKALVLGKTLTRASRQQLVTWMLENKVSGPLLRASLPKNWRIADRSGAGGYGARSIIAVIWPPERGPVVAAIYITENKASMEDRNKAISEIGGVLVSVLEGLKSSNEMTYSSNQQ